MSDDTDWLRSRRGVCKVELYSPKERQDQERKVICFVDVSTLTVEDKDSKSGAGSNSSINLNLNNLEDKEIIVIKDTKKQDQSKMEGSVCLFKQTPSDPLSVFTCLLNDLQKYALGFQHALSPSASSCKEKVGDTEDENNKTHSENYCSVYADKLCIDMAKGPQSLCLDTAAKNTNNNQSPSTHIPKSPSPQKANASTSTSCAMDDLSYYVNRLSSLVTQLAHKEIKEKLENGSKCLHHSAHSSTGEKEKNCPQSVVSKIASDMAHEAIELTSAEMYDTGEDSREGGQKSFLYSEVSSKNKNGEKQMWPKESKEFSETVNKRLMIYANQVASDVLFSIMKSLQVQSVGKPIPACVVLKRVLLKHTKEIVSDLIDSCMKNLHNITGVLMTDSDFVFAVKRNLFNHGKQNATEIMEAMLKRLVSALLGDRQIKSQSLSYASWKAGSQDPTCKNQNLEFSAVKAEVKGNDNSKMKSTQCKSLTSAEKVSEHLLKEGLTIWNQKQENQCRTTSKLCTSKNEKKNISPSTDSLAKDLIVSALKLIQYHLTQQTKDKDTHEEASTSSSVNYMSQSNQYENCGSSHSSRLLSLKHLDTSESPGPSTSVKETQLPEFQKMDMSNIVLSVIQKLLNENPMCSDEGGNRCSEARTSKPSPMANRSDRVEEPCQGNDFTNGIKQVNHQFVEQLVDSVMKLCMVMAKYSDNGSANAESEEQEAASVSHASSSRRCQETFMSKSYNSNGPEVIINNQSSTNNMQKQLQAVLQWLAASEFNVPLLYFIGDKDGQLEKLPEVSAKAAEKGYSVGDLLQEVMKFAKERQLDDAVGNIARKQLLDWLLANL